MASPIGISDSGSGGLTVLDALVKRLPGQSFVYLGDHKNAPYGERTEEEITAFTIGMLERLFSRNIQLVVLACNTASAIALRKIQEEWLPKNYPKRRVLGVLVPMVEALTGLPWDRDNPGTSNAPPRTVAVFATVRTVASGTYPRQIQLRTRGFKMFQQACPGLAAAIENDARESELRDMVAGYCASLLSQMKGDVPDAVFLGCTHYPLVENLFRDNLPNSVEILSQPEIVAQSLKAYLGRHPELASTGKPTLEFFTTGRPEALAHLAKFMPGAKLNFKSI